MSHRPTIYGTRHAVSAGHYLAAAAGFAILEAGGNAIDAGCAAGIALGVLQPDLVNVAGVAPILLRLADGTVESIAGLGWWPATLPADLFMRAHGGKIPDGVLRTVVPAAPDAWITVLRRHGTMRFADVAAPAIRFAAEGFSVYPLLSASIAAHEREYRRWASNTAVFLPGNRVPRPGEKFVQSDLARTLQFMADQDRSAGPDRMDGLAAAHHAFYRGDIAREIVRVREAQPLTRTTALAALLGRVVRTREAGKHPATRTFQALRIWINDELGQIERGLAQALELLAPGGRLVAISFQSLEDRLVKSFIRRHSQPDPMFAGLPELPPLRRFSRLQPPPQARPTLRRVGSKQRASLDEIRANPRARSALLRVAERLAPPEPLSSMRPLTPMERP